MMTPIDPAFLLIPLLRVTVPVRIPVVLRDVVLQLVQQTDGSSNFLPPEDLIEEAANRLSAGHPDKTLSSEDIAQLSSLRCIQSAIRHVCDFKGLRVCLSCIVVLN